MCAPNQSRKNLDVEGSLLIVRQCSLCGVNGMVSTFTTCFDLGIFTRCIVVNQRAIGHLSKEIDQCIDVYSVCPWGKIK